MSMNNVEYLLNEYSSIDYFMYTTVIPFEKWGDKDAAKSYMDKYFLSDSDFDKEVSENITSIFNNIDKPFPSACFSDYYKVSVEQGGRLLNKTNYEQLQAVAMNAGDLFFYVIQNNLGGSLGEPTFQMKFPTDIDWNEIMSGNYISTILFEMPYNEYFVLGQNKSWGMYCTNEHFPPLHILGIR